MKMGKLLKGIGRIISAPLFVAAIILSYWAIMTDSVLLWIFAMLAAILAIAIDMQNNNK